MKKYFAYVLLNTENKKIYIGQTSDLKNRLMRHNRLKKSKITSYSSKNLGKGFWKLVYCEEYNLRKQVIIREKQLKSYQGRLFIKGLLAQLVEQSPLKRSVVGSIPTQPTKKEL